MFNKIYKFKYYTHIKNQSGATVLLMLILMLGSILTITLSASDIIRSGLKLSNIQYNSTKAYFAAEAGAERILFELRKPRYDFDACADPSCVTFDSDQALTSNIIVVGNDIACNTCDDTNEIQKFSNQTEYFLEYSTDALETVIKSFGTYNDISGENINRVVELRY